MTNEEAVWLFLIDKLNNPYGAAAVMGNFYIESRIDPKSLQSSFARKNNITGDQYTENVDSGVYDSHSFAYDKAGYGLAQWAYWSRKLALLTFAKEAGTSVGDLHTQLEFFWHELRQYTTVLNALANATSEEDLIEASDTFARRYEKPADLSAEALTRRSAKALFYFEMFHGSPCKMVRVTANNVNMRAGNGKLYPSVTRAQSGEMFPWVATSGDGWHAVENGNRVLWLHPDYSEVVQ